MTRLQNLETNVLYDRLPIQGAKLFESLKGFAEILDTAKDPKSLDPALTSIYMCIGFTNGATVKIVNQIVDINMQRNVVTIRTSDYATHVAPDSVRIFSLEDVCLIESVDCAHLYKRDAEIASLGECAEQVEKSDELVTPVETSSETKNSTKTGKETTPKSIPTKENKSNKIVENKNE